MISLQRSHLAIAVFVVALGLPGTALAGRSTPASIARVTVTLTDAKLAVSPAGLQAGRARFLVVNKGKRLHSLAITGPGIRSIETRKLAPGGSAALTVQLRTGAYMLTLSNPAGLGMSSTHWLQVIPRTVVSSTGNGSVVQNPPDPVSPVCGGLMP